jgi:hypothetical protein
MAKQSSKAASSKAALKASAPTASSKTVTSSAASKVSATKTARKASSTKAARALGSPSAATKKVAAKQAKRAITKKVTKKAATSRTAITGRFVQPRARPGVVVQERRIAIADSDTDLVDEQAVGRFRQLLQTAEGPLRRRLIDAVSLEAQPPHDEAEPDISLWGPPPDASELLAAELEDVRTRFRLRRELAARSASRDVAAEILHVTPQAVTDHLRHGDLVGLKHGKRWLIPLWQFDADCERGFLPGIATVKAAFPGGVVSLSRWMTEPNPNFNDRTPREELTAGHATKVAALAAALTSAGW